MAEEAPLCRFRRIEIIGRGGDGISPNLVKNLHIVRRVGTLSTAQFKTAELKKRKSFCLSGNTCFYLTIEAKRFEVFPLGGENYKL